MTEQTALPATAHPKRAADARVNGPLGWLRDEIDHLFDTFTFNRPMPNLFTFPYMFKDATPLAELIKKDNGYCLSIELPGIAEKDIDISLADDTLTIKAEKRAESESKEDGYLINERSYGALHRQITLPADVDPESISANVENGVLSIEMKKDKAAASQVRKIAIGG